MSWQALQLEDAAKLGWGPAEGILDNINQIPCQIGNTDQVLALKTLSHRDAKTHLVARTEPVLSYELSLCPCCG